MKIDVVTIGWRLKYEIPRLPRMARHEIRHRWQRARQGYSTSDLWSFDDYLAKLLVKALSDFKRAPGYPGEFEDVQDWYDVLDEMIDGFQAWADLESYEPAQYDVAAEKVKRSLALLTEHYGSLWW